MKFLKIQTAFAGPRWFSLLEKRGLIKLLKPSSLILRSPRGTGAVDVVYSSTARHGGHKLICVKPDSVVPCLNSHPDNEEFILIDPRKGAIRPLYMLVGLASHRVLARKARQKTLSEKDFVLLRMGYNSAASVFTMCKDTVHCEIVFPGRGRAPVFFVAEPARLSMDFLRLPGYEFHLSKGR
jgi:hypothetical protein